LFAIIFMWTPPHFWALSLFKSDDYERVGVPMMPVVAGDRATRRLIMIYSLLLVPLAVVPVFTGLGGWVYGVASTALGAGFLYFAGRVWLGETGAPMKLFGFSILYLFLLFAVLLVEHLFGWA
jgi:protoheme IX farnesyltransferase